MAVRPGIRLAAHPWVGSTMQLVAIDSLSDAGHLHNEDAVGSTPAAAWVVDGTKGPFDHTLTPGPTDAAWHAQALNAALFARYADPAADPFSALTQAADLLSSTYARIAAAAPSHEQPSACLALAAIDSSANLHLFNVGDCRILIEKAGKVSIFGSSGIERLESAAKAELVRLRAMVGDDYDPWPLLRSRLRENFKTAMNKPGGYWVVHPTSPWLHAVERAKVAARDIDHILIASDGFFRLVNVFGAYDAAALVANTLRGGGLRTLCAELRSREADDSLCRSYPRLKDRDDASAVLVRIEL